MNIAYITMQFPAPSETFVSIELRNLLKNPVNLSVYSLRFAHKNTPRMLQQRGCENIPVVFPSIWRGLGIMAAHPRLAGSLLKLLFSSCLTRPTQLIKSILLLPAAFYTWSLLKNKQPDIVHLFWGHYPSLVGWLVKQSNLPCQLSIFLGAYDLTMKYPLSQVILHQADHAFTHAKINLPEIREMAEVPVRLIYNGVDLDRLAEIPSGNRDPGCLLVASRLIKAKRIDLIIDVFAALAKKHADMSLVIAGDGPERRSLEHRAHHTGFSDRIRFIGHVTQHTLFEEMGRAGMFALMSEKEGERLPNVLKEAMYLGCICLSSITPGIDELIEPGVTGVLVHSNRITDLVHEIDQLMENPDTRKAMRGRAKTYIIDQFDSEKLVKKYIHEWARGPKRPPAETL